MCDGGWFWIGLGVGGLGGVMSLGFLWLRAWWEDRNYRRAGLRLVCRSLFF